MQQNIVFQEVTESIVIFYDGGQESVAIQEVTESLIVFAEGRQGLTGAQGEQGDPGDTSGLTWNETPTGTVNGTNPTFTLAGTPADSTKLLLSNNGLILRHGASNDFTLTASTINFNSGAIPLSGDTVLATYSTA